MHQSDQCQFKIIVDMIFFMAFFLCFHDFFLNFMILKTFNSEFLYIKVWFIDQNTKPLEIEDKLTLF